MPSEVAGSSKYQSAELDLCLQNGVTRPDKAVYVQNQVWTGEREAFSNEQKFDLGGYF